MKNAVNVRNNTLHKDQYKGNGTDFQHNSKNFIHSLCLPCFIIRLRINACSQRSHALSLPGNTNTLIVYITQQIFSKKRGLHYGLLASICFSLHFLIAIGSLFK